MKSAKHSVMAKFLPHVNFFEDHMFSLIHMFDSKLNPAPLTLNSQKLILGVF